MPFRAVRKVTDPAGTEWELYVSRYVLPEWRQGDYNSWVDEGPIETPQFAPLMLMQVPFMLLGFLWSAVISPLLRFVFLFPYAFVKGRRSRTARIEAICFGVEPETRVWTTTLDQLDSVLDTVALGLEEGRVAQPRGAVYTGSRRG
jgi:hypothetical protein